MASSLLNQNPLHGDPSGNHKTDTKSLIQTLARHQRKQKLKTPRLKTLIQAVNHQHAAIDSYSISSLLKHPHISTPSKALILKRHGETVTQLAELITTEIADCAMFIDAESGELSA